MHLIICNIGGCCKNSAENRCAACPEKFSKLKLSASKSCFNVIPHIRFAFCVKFHAVCLTHNIQNHITENG